MEKQKKPFYKKWWVWLLAVVIVIMIANAGGETPSEVVPTSASNTTEKPKAKEDVKSEYAVGEQIQLGDNALTVVKVEKSQGNDFDKPQAGKEYVIVTVEIENKGSKNITYNPFDFKMSNSQGQLVDSAFSIVDSDTALQSGELAPSGKVSGTVSFEMPKDDPKLQLEYVASFWSDKTIKVNLQ